jgi:hypothetical protein
VPATPDVPPPALPPAAVPAPPSSFDESDGRDEQAPNTTTREAEASAEVTSKRGRGETRRISLMVTWIFRARSPGIFCSGGILAEARSGAFGVEELDVAHPESCRADARLKRFSSIGFGRYGGSHRRGL